MFRADVALERGLRRVMARGVASKSTAIMPQSWVAALERAAVEARRQGRIEIGTVDDGGTDAGGRQCKRRRHADEAAADDNRIVGMPHGRTLAAHRIARKSMITA